MLEETVHAEWVRDQLFLLRDRYDFPVVMTQPMGVNGSDLLPLSLIGCAAWDIMTILRKQHQVVTSLQISALSQRDEEPPWRFRSIHVQYRFGGPHLERGRVARAIELTETRYCSTWATLAAAVALSSSFEVVGEGDGA
jgi:putative redox protein